MKREPSILTVRIRRVLPAPPSSVFEVVGTAEGLAGWWGPHGFAIPAIDFEPEVGRPYRIAMQPPDGELFHLEGEFTEVAPPRRLAYTFRWEDPDREDVETTVTLSLRDLGGETELTMEQGPFAAESRRALHEQGWSDGLDKVAALLGG